MELTLHVWRQRDARSQGRMETIRAKNVHPDMSFLEMLDVVNEGLIADGQEPIAFEYDCREGICGTCSLMINGKPHGPHRGVTTCQTYMRDFKDGDEVWIEPWRAKAFPVLKDLVTDRAAFDLTMESKEWDEMNADAFNLFVVEEFIVDGHSALLDEVIVVP